MNITDIDDKIIRKAIEANVPFETISRKCETEFLDDLKRLNVGLPEVITCVSDYVPRLLYSSFSKRDSTQRQSRSKWTCHAIECVDW